MRWSTTKLGLKHKRSLHLCGSTCGAGCHLRRDPLPSDGLPCLPPHPRGGHGLQRRWRWRQGQCRNAARATPWRLLFASNDHTTTKEEAKANGSADHGDRYDQEVPLRHCHPDPSKKTEATANRSTHLGTKLDAVHASPSPWVRDPLVTDVAPAALLLDKPVIIQAVGLVNARGVLGEVHVVVAGGCRRCAAYRRRQSGRRGSRKAGRRCWRLLARGWCTEGRATRWAGGRCLLRSRLLA
mmetsp:Transcript_23917/g.59597  ORF Transcript_23917/g.59597 Transcript_23917/m.59597 type:complete len:240 (+) Transcript_23917:176-895(+)